MDENLPGVCLTGPPFIPSADSLSPSGLNLGVEAPQLPATFHPGTFHCWVLIHSHPSPLCTAPIHLKGHPSGVLEERALPPPRPPGMEPVSRIDMQDVFSEALSGRQSAGQASENASAQEKV